MSYANQVQATVTLDGVSMGEFSKFSGGDVTAEVTKHRPGGMKAEKLYPTSLRTAADVVFERVYERERDHEWVRLARARCGRGVITATEQLLDDDGVPWGTPDTWKGYLVHVEPSEADANSSDLRTFALTGVVGLPA